MTTPQPRVPGSVAEIDGSLEGPSVAAFFDFDGTLIAGYSAAVMAQDSFKRREIGLADLLSTVRVSVQMGMGRADFSDFMKLTADGWKGRSHEDLEELGERLYREKIADMVYPEARELVAAHQRRGHTVAVTSSATRYQVAALARDLGIDAIVCTELELKDGTLTGNLAGAPPWGEGKSAAAQAFAAAHGIDLAQSYFYADGNEDVALMHVVGKPRPTNPGKRLEQVAQRRAWPIQRFASRGRPAPATRLRNLAGLASIAPIAVVSAGIGAVRRDNRVAANRAPGRWAEAVFGLNGVKVHVTGEQHLSAARPAVFVFDQRGRYDALVAASIVRKDFVVLASESPVAGAVGWLTDTVRLDPAATAGDVSALAETLTAEGRSLLAAFDDIPLKVAMAGGLPVVPIVLRGADRLWGNDPVIRSGTVEVEVLAPRSANGSSARALAALRATIGKQLAG